MLQVLGDPSWPPLDALNGNVLLQGVSFRFWLLCPLPSPADPGCHSVQLSSSLRALGCTVSRPLASVQGHRREAGGLWTVPGHGDDRDLRVGPQGSGWCRLHLRSDWLRALAERVCGLSRTHRTIPYPSSQTHVPRSLPPAACWSLVIGTCRSGSPGPTGSFSFRLWPRVLRSPGFWWGGWFGCH